MSGFDDFWKAYPRKTGIGAARRQFSNEILFHGADPEQMISAARAYREKMADTDERFIQKPVTFLRDQTYLDPDLNIEIPEAENGLAEKIGIRRYASWFSDAEFDGDVIRLKEWKAQHIERHLPDVMRVLEREGKRIERV